MKVKVILLLLLATFNVSVFASDSKPKQKTQVVTVTDNNGEALAGVEVIVDGCNKTLYTDFEGKVLLESCEATTITLNYILHDTKEVVVKPGKNITVVLNPTN